MDKKNDLIAFLKKTNIFSELSEEEIELVANAIISKTFQKNETIIHEGEKGQDLFILKSGKAEIVKEHPPYPPVQIALVGPGETFGEMSLLEKTPRSASVRALETTEALVLDLASVEHLHNKIVKGLSRKLSSILRKTDQNLVNLLEEKIEDFNLRVQASNLFMAMIFCTAFYVLAQKIVIDLFGDLNAVSVSAFGFSVVIFQAIAALIVIWKSEYPLEFYGISFKNWKQEVWGGILYSLPVLALFTAGKWAAIQFIPQFHNIPLFELLPEKSHYRDLYLLFTVAYLLLIPLQEFVARGCFQGCLRKFFVNKNKVLISIIGSNLLFGAAHLVKSIPFAIGAFFMGVYWGFLYERQKTLIGVNVSHILIAVWVFYIINLSKMLGG